MMRRRRRAARLSPRLTVPALDPQPRPKRNAGVGRSADCSGRHVPSRPREPEPRWQLARALANPRAKSPSPRACPLRPLGARRDARRRRHRRVSTRLVPPSRRPRDAPPSRGARTARPYPPPRPLIRPARPPRHRPRARPEGPARRARLGPRSGPRRGSRRRVVATPTRLCDRVRRVRRRRRARASSRRDSIPRAGIFRDRT